MFVRDSKTSVEQLAAEAPLPPEKRNWKTRLFSSRNQLKKIGEYFFETVNF